MFQRWTQIAAIVLLSLRFCVSGSTLDPKAVDDLFRMAEEKQSNALFVHEKGQPVREKFFNTRDRRIYLYSVTKLFSGLAIGIVRDKGLIASVEDPVGKYLPEMNLDATRAKIRIRHILQHTSGIQTTKGSRDIYPQADFVKFAMESSVISEPGEVYEYNNRAINLVSGVIRRVSGKSMEDFLVENLFKPLDIRDYKFGRDKAGNTWAMDGLELKASDLVKVGKVLANGGMWKEQRIVSEALISTATRPCLLQLDRPSAMGLALFCSELDSRLSIPKETLVVLEKAQVSESTLAVVRSLIDREFNRQQDLGKEMKQTLTPAQMERIAQVCGEADVPLFRRLPGGRHMVWHQGEFGVNLIAVPEIGVSVARTIDDNRGRGKPNGFEEIYTLFSKRCRR